MADLITLARLKIALGIDPADTTDDDRLGAAVSAASQLIRTYTDREFDVNTGGSSSVRSFEYDGSGYLDIDDAQSITAVEVVPVGYTTGTPVNSGDWTAYPFSGPVFYWIRIPASPWHWGSPAMGFTRNLDQLDYWPYGGSSIARVTAVWGWPEIPADVQQATVWTALNLSDNPHLYQSESIAAYSRTYSTGGGFGEQPDTAIPQKAQFALAPYIQPRV